MTEAEMIDATYWAGFWSGLEHWMFLGVVVTLALEFLAVKLAEPHKEKLEHARQLEITRLTNDTTRLAKEGDAARAEIGKASVETAKLNVEAERLKAANLALQKLMQPRRLPSLVELGVLPTVTVPGREQFNISFIAKFAGTPAVIQYVNDREAEALATDMMQALAGFKWMPEIVTEAETGIPSNFIQEGVEVTFPAPGKFGEAARALAGAFSKLGLTGPLTTDHPIELHASGYQVGADGNPFMRSYPHFNPPRDVVVVLIGTKPFPNRRGEPITGFIKPSAPNGDSVPK